MLDIKQTETYLKWERKLKDRRAKALIAARVFRLANGLAGDVKPVGHGVSELRINHGPGYRVYSGNMATKSCCCFAEEISAPSSKTSRQLCVSQMSGELHERTYLRLRSSRCAR
nr:type II toxin-antitoxin system RelE/ParE family toxin [uncultured Halomonas sp.]